MKIGVLFIANRGEIALRIMRTAHRLGVKCVLGASEADEHSLPAIEADAMVRLGPAPSSQSYLAIDRVVAAARSAGADAVHPGYGFLSENQRFAQAVAEAGLIFVGPTPAQLAAVGDKLKARAVAEAAGVPLVPGGEAADAAAAGRVAEAVGYPLLIKAVAGGGGRGMKRVDEPKNLSAMIDLAMSEAQAAFGDPAVYIERFIRRGRHVEVQVIGDGERAIHLGTRDCSIQRRFQKLVEEAPAPFIPDKTRAAIESAAVRLAEHIGYKGAGTVEFMLDAETFDFYFLEMNARIQVEHPVTEEITGVDLVEQQLLIASGAPLGLRQGDVRFDGCAIEMRINAEDPAADFRPSPGRIGRAVFPAGPGVRVDSHIRAGSVITPNYDSLLSKLIVSGPTREIAIELARSALSRLSVEGVATTLPLHVRIVTDDRFRRGAVDTRYLDGAENG